MRRTIIALGLALALAACTSGEGGGSSPGLDGAATTSPTPDGAATASPSIGITVDAMHEHLDALQAIADEHEGTRAVATPGYDASVAYVTEVLHGAGYEVELQTVDVPVFEQDAPTVLERVEPSPRTWADDVDLRAMLFSAAGEVEAPVTEAEGGCDPNDLAGFPEGDIALLDPGPCLRRQQVLNAQAAGASAVIVPYPDTVAGRPLRPTLLYPDGIEVPVIAVTPEVGDALAPRTGASVHLRVEASSRWTQAQSVLAQTSTGDPETVVMLGAHLDSVMDGPGINDDGSGVAMLLEIARWTAARETGSVVRFGFWAGEEEGLYGSRGYVQWLPEEERAALAAYVNLDMVASPNFIRYVIADAPMEPEAAEGNERIRALFEGFFSAQGLATEPSDVGGGADHGAFAQEGIPVGGLFAGSVEVKTAEEADAYGGEAGELIDACYHQACDTAENVSDVALAGFAAAYVHVLTELAGIPETS